MPKTVQIRDIDDDIYQALVKRAASVGLSVPEFLRREAVKLAKRPTMEEWFESTRGIASKITDDEIVAALDEWRGPRPDAGG